MSKRAQAKRFIAECNKIAEESYNRLFSKSQLRKIAQSLRLKGNVVGGRVLNVSVMVAVKPTRVRQRTQPRSQASLEGQGKAYCP